MRLRPELQKAENWNSVSMSRIKILVLYSGKLANELEKS